MRVISFRVVWARAKNLPGNPPPPQSAAASPVLPARPGPGAEARRQLPLCASEVDQQHAPPSQSGAPAPWARPRRMTLAGKAATGRQAQLREAALAWVQASVSIRRTCASPARCRASAATGCGGPRVHPPMGAAELDINALVSESSPCRVSTMPLDLRQLQLGRFTATRCRQRRRDAGLVHLEPGRAKALAGLAAG